MIGRRSGAGIDRPHLDGSRDIWPLRSASPPLPKAVRRCWDRSPARASLHLSRHLSAAPLKLTVTKNSLHIFIHMDSICPHKPLWSRNYYGSHFQMRRFKRLINCPTSQARAEVELRSSLKPTVCFYYYIRAAPTFSHHGTFTVSGTFFMMPLKPISNGFIDYLVKSKQL